MNAHRFVEHLWGIADLMGALLLVILLTVALLCVLGTLTFLGYGAICLRPRKAKPDQKAPK